MDVGPVDTECQLYDYINYCFTTYTCRERLGEKLLIRMVADVAEWRYFLQKLSFEFKNKVNAHPVPKPTIAIASWIFNLLSNFM